MKRALYLIVATNLIISSYLMSEHTHEHDELRVIIEPHWQNLEHSAEHASRFGGQWILAGSITFKKKTKRPLFLTELHLTWHGPHVTNLLGSLYDKPLDKTFMPIEDSLLCDGSWNEKTQTLLLRFNTKKALSAVDIFYLVLTVPHHLEPELKKGYFDIQAVSVPEPLSFHTHDSLRLSLDALDCITTQS